MSQRKNGTLFYTKEELDRAIENSSALEYALSRYQLKRAGNRYTMPEHDSMVFTPDGKWFWNSHGVYGNALDFMQIYEGKSYVEAVLTLAGTLHSPPMQAQETLPPVTPTPPAPTQEPVPFVLPEMDKSQKYVFAYLHKTRGISPQLIRPLLKDRHIMQVRQFVGMRICGYAGSEQDNAALYIPSRPDMEEAVRPYLQERQIVSRDVLHPLPEKKTVLCVTGEEASQLAQQGILQEKHRLAMLGYDAEGNAQYCSIRSMNSIGKGFKMDMPGSNKQWPFLLPGSIEAKGVVIVESPIEAMSYRDLCTMTGSVYKNYPILALGGVKVSLGLENFLANHPEISEIRLGLNRDDDGKHKEKAGERATERLKQTYGERYQISVHVPLENDWNDVLKKLRGIQPPELQQQRNTPMPQR